MTLPLKPVRWGREKKEKGWETQTFNLASLKDITGHSEAQQYIVHV